jgi:outer membrane cobalamin receptor
LEIYTISKTKIPLGTHLLLKKTILSFFLVLFAHAAFSQTGIKGTITTAKTKETLAGVTVIADDTNAVSSEPDGSYFLKLEPGNHNVAFKLIGFTQKKLSVEINEGEIKTLNISLEESSKELGLVVVSASKFEQRIEDVTVSMEVIKPTLVENKNTTSMEDILDQVPGVNVVDQQANIRGGAGWSYGAGSRVLVLVDDLPEITADAGDVKWSFLPVENLEQIEVIKGASSALFGSSALNGVINIRTAYPRDTPMTKINFFTGIYDTDQKLKSGDTTYNINWAGSIPQRNSGMDFLHSRKIKNLDFVMGGNIFMDEGYRQGEHEYRGRINANLRYHPQHMKGLSYGVNVNTMFTDGSLFFLWNDDSTGAYIPLPNTLSSYQTHRTNVDPFITYVDKKGNSLKLRTRWFNTINENSTNQESTGNFYYSELQYQKHFSENVVVTGGVVRSFSEVRSELYQDHSGDNLAFYAQGDLKWKKFSFSFGGRAEQNALDTVKEKFITVARAGINYHLFNQTHLRASFGQGYRYPSVAEKFVKTEVGGVFVYPNSSLDFEKGFSSEIGIRQGFKVGRWLGYLDAAAFWTEYENMIEFVFGPWDSVYIDANGIHGFGFRSFNIGDTRIKGIDISFGGSGEIAPGLKVSALAGITFIDPKQISFDSAYIKVVESPFDTFLVGRNSYLGSDSSYYLKYRFSTMIKADVELEYKKVSFGIGMRYNSFMKNVDKAFATIIQPSPFFPPTQIVPGLKHYRETHRTGDAVFDARLSYQLIKFLKTAFIVKNVFNRIYMGRPGDMQAPRSFVVQVSCVF